LNIAPYLFNMLVDHIILKNWRNFPAVDVSLGNRVFLVGPNACGKSNFLDVFRFLHDLAKPGGGLQRAISTRGGLFQIRCLSATFSSSPDIEIEIHLAPAPYQKQIWKYAIGIRQHQGDDRQPYVSYERVWKGETMLLSRPDKEDEKDELRLTQTHLEQISANGEFRAIAKFFQSVLYLHLVPQLLRHPQAFSGYGVSEDPFGRSFLERVTKTPEVIRQERLAIIEKALRIAVRELNHITLIKDEMGIPHLQAKYEHWHGDAGKQSEEQFSDGTLRLIGLLWSLLENESLLLLEEPELSLNPGIVRKLPSLMYRIQSQQPKQIISSTHSVELLSDPGIGGEEVLLLTPSIDFDGTLGTQVQLASSFLDVRDLLEGGLSVAEAVLPKTIPSEVYQLELRL